MAFLLAIGVLLVILSCALKGWEQINHILNIAYFIINLSISTPHYTQTHKFPSSTPSFCFRNWLPLIVIVFYLLSPLPNLIASRLSGNDLMMANEGAYVESGYFITSIFVVSGIGKLEKICLFDLSSPHFSPTYYVLAFPLILLRGGSIETESALLAVFGGILVYATMTLYSVIFGRDQDTF